MTGHKRWLRLEEVTSDDLNGFLADQVVERFATVAARDAAIPAPTDGQATWTPATGLLFWRADLGAWLPDRACAWGLVAPVKPLNQTVNAQAWIARWQGLTLYPGRAYEVRATVPITTFGIPAAPVEFHALGVIGTQPSAVLGPHKIYETVPASGIVMVSGSLPFSVATKTTFAQVGMYGAATAAKINGGQPGAVGIYDLGPLPTGPVPDAG
jgi:hypothetical protein